jgi:hypothetical protein
MRKGTEAIYRELAWLKGAGPVAVQPVEGKKFYQANRASPVFDEMASALRRSGGCGCRSAASGGIPAPRAP